MFKVWIKNVFIALDQFCNALLKGHPDETLSSRCWRWHRDGKRSWPKHFVDFVAANIFKDYNHCYESYESERLGRQLPPELRKS